MPRYLFVGERPSPRALTIGATWRNGKLSGKTLQAALVAAGIDPKQQRYTNLLDCNEQVRRHQVYSIRRALDNGFTVVALGMKVHRALTVANVRHLRLIHPAVRGKMRLRANYHNHVLEELSR